jgi:thiosulfate/3-mercaptopyruvate sulfurtransferase
MAQVINENKYIHPEVLVDTKWVEEHLDDKNVRIAEVDYDAKANYDLGHVPGSVLIAWKEDINDPLSRNILTLHEYVQLLGRIGVNNDTTLILYGDFNNWFAAFAFWVFKYYRYKDVRLLNGGRKKWLQEDRPVTKDIPQYPTGNYRILADESSYEPDNSIRIFLDETKNALISRRKFQIGLVDVRSPKEFTGEILGTTGISYRTCTKGRTYTWCNKYSLGTSSQ